MGQMQITPSVHDKHAKHMQKYPNTKAKNPEHLYMTFDILHARVQTQVSRVSQSGKDFDMTSSVHDKHAKWPGFERRKVCTYTKHKGKKPGTFVHDIWKCGWDLACVRYHTCKNTRECTYMYKVPWHAFGYHVKYLQSACHLACCARVVTHDSGSICNECECDIVRVWHCADMYSGIQKCDMCTTMRHDMCANTWSTYRVHVCNMYTKVWHPSAMTLCECDIVRVWHCASVCDMCTTMRHDTECIHMTSSVCVVGMRVCKCASVNCVSVCVCVPPSRVHELSREGGTHGKKPGTFVCVHCMFVVYARCMPCSHCSRRMYTCKLCTCTLYTMFVVYARCYACMLPYSLYHLHRNIHSVIQTRAHSMWIMWYCTFALGHLYVCRVRSMSWYLC